MTTENTTESSVISRRTILRTTANAAWLVPAITVANAVPAMAACSVHQAPHFTHLDGSASASVRKSNKNTFTQTVTVTSTGGAGTAAIVATLTSGPAILGIPDVNQWAISIDSGWSGGLSSGTAGKTGSKYTFTRAFNTACGEQSAPKITVQYHSVLGALGLETVSKPTLSFDVTPH